MQEEKKTYPYCDTVVELYVFIAQLLKLNWRHYFFLFYHFAIFKPTIPLEPGLQPASVRLLERNRVCATIEFFWLGSICMLLMDKESATRSLLNKVFNSI